MAQSPYAYLKLDQTGEVTQITFTTPTILDEGTIRTIEEELLRLEKLGRRRLLLNFRNVKYLSSSFLATLVKLHRKVVAAEGRLALCAIDPEIYKVFEVTHLNRVLRIYPSQEEAIQTF